MALWEVWVGVSGLLFSIFVEVFGHTLSTLFCYWVHTLSELCDCTVGCADGEGDDERVRGCDVLRMGV